jgi:hypothetical protein
MACDLVDTERVAALGAPQPVIVALALVHSGQRVESLKQKIPLRLERLELF